MLKDLVDAFKTLFELFPYKLVVADKSTGYNYFIYEKGEVGDLLVKAQTVDEALMRLAIATGATRDDVDFWCLHQNSFDPLNTFYKTLFIESFVTTMLS